MRYQNSPDLLQEEKLPQFGIQRFQTRSEGARYLNVITENPEEEREIFKERLLGIIYLCEDKISLTTNRSRLVALRKIRNALESITKKQCGGYKNPRTLKQILHEEKERIIDDFWS
jgi:hypothetical protein